MGPQIPVAIQAELDKLLKLLWNSIGVSPQAGGRNSATGPNASQVIPQTPATVTLDWLVVESTGVAGVNVPVTPKVTGKMRVQGVIMVEISGELAEDVVIVQLFVDGVQVTEYSSGIDTPAASGISTVAIPFLFSGFQVTVGVTHNVQIKCSVVNQSTTNITLPAPSIGVGGTSNIDIQELLSKAG